MLLKNRQPEKVRGKDEDAQDSLLSGALPVFLLLFAFNIHWGE